MINGFYGNLGDLAVSIVTAGRSPAYQLQADPRLPSRACGDESGTKRGRSKVSPSEGNEVRRKDCQEVGASHSTDEPGEPPEGPWGGKEAPSYETAGGKHDRYAET